MSPPNLDVDVRDPELILSDAHNLLNFNQPIAVMLMGILGRGAPTFEEMRSIVGRLMAGVPSGSYLVLHDGLDEGDEGYREASALHKYHLRTRDEFQACAEGLQVVEPGFVPYNLWRATSVDVGSIVPLRGRVVALPMRFPRRPLDVRSRSTACGQRRRNCREPNTGEHATGHMDIEDRAGRRWRCSTDLSSSGVGERERSPTPARIAGRAKSPHAFSRVLQPGADRLTLRIRTSVRARRAWSLKDREQHTPRSASFGRA